MRYKYADEYIDKNIGTTMRLLGSGVHGEAWLLNDGSVVKVTSDTDEAACVPILFDIQESDPIEYIKYFPKIYSYGHIPNGVLRPFSFWYRREAVLDIFQNTRDYQVTLKMLTLFRQQVVENFGIELDDIHLGNFGVRENEPNNLIYRDLSCRVV